MREPGPLIFWKVLHTIVWAFMVGCILFVFYSGITGSITTLTWVAAALVLIEAGVLLVNGWVCPITPIARKYSDSEKDNFDIYLPNWLARHNKAIFTVIFSLGLILVLIRNFNQL